MNYIIVGKSSKPSIESITGQLSSIVILRKVTLRNGNTQWKKRNKNKWIDITLPEFNSEDKILRWGCSTPLILNGAIVYNDEHAINLASNKYNARMKMRECGIPIPLTLDYLHSFGFMSYPIIVRPIKHYGGNNFYIIHNNEELERFYRNIDIKKYYNSEVYNKKQEYRVHVAHGKILSILEKPLTEGMIQANFNQTGTTWNLINWNNYKLDICKISCDVVKVIGLDCGAVDVMVDRDNEEMPICICEVNTCPSLSSSPYDQTRYIKYINWLFNNETKREWFNYTQWKKSNSFAFKNFQFGE